MFQQYLSKRVEEDLIDQFQSQRRICSQYIRMASEKLYILQAQRIGQANDLLQKISLKEKVKDLSEWDCFSTKDTLFEDENSISLQTVNGEGRRMISRKNILGVKNQRGADGELSECLLEIEKGCSERVYSTMRMFADEFKRMKGRMQQCQKKQKTMKLKDKTIADLQQKNMALTKIIAQLEQNIQNSKRRQDLNKQQDKKLKQNIESCNILKCQYSAKPKQNDLTKNSYQILNIVLDEKSNLLNHRSRTVRVIEGKIEQLLFNGDNSCLSCCVMMRKMKTSILSYKEYLEREGECFQKMVDAYKDRILVGDKENV